MRGACEKAFSFSFSGLANGFLRVHLNSVKSPTEIQSLFTFTTLLACFTNEHKNLSMLLSLVPLDILHKLRT